MNTKGWREVAELIGIAAIVASLVFVGLQLRQEQNIAVAALGQSEIASRTDLNLGMSEFAEVWDKSNRGEPLSGAESLIMESLIDAWFRRALIGSQDREGLGGGSDSTSRRLFSVFLYQNTGARCIWEIQREKERKYIQHLNPRSTFINDFAEEVRLDLMSLDELEKRVPSVSNCE